MTEAEEAAYAYAVLKFASGIEKLFWCAVMLVAIFVMYKIASKLPPPPPPSPEDTKWRDEGPW